MYQLLAKLCGLVIAMVVVLVVVLDNVNPMESTPEVAAVEAGTASLSASEQAEALAAAEQTAADAVSVPQAPQAPAQPQDRVADTGSSTSYQGTLPAPAIQFEDDSDKPENDVSGTPSDSEQDE
jgi:hypothetical protein